MSRFEFEVEARPVTVWVKEPTPERPWAGHAEPTGETMFRVFLPHQCDDWEITGNGDLKYDTVEYTREQAIADLEEFITEAQAALETLRTIEPKVTP